MQLGRHLRELLGLRAWAGVCLLIAFFAALTVTYKVSLLPPGLENREHEIASAKTDMLVDTPLSSVLDLRQGSSELTQMTNRAILIGNVAVSPPVLSYIAKRAGIPAGKIRAQAPLTPDFPRPLGGRGHDPKTTDILKDADQYRINIQSNPSVPVLSVFTEAPSPKAAVELANATVVGLRDYLQATARTQGTPPSNVVRLTQLGSADAETINDGARTELAVVSFIIVFGLSSAFAIFLSRVRKGFAEGPAPRGPAPAASA